MTSVEGIKEYEEWVQELGGLGKVVRIGASYGPATFMTAIPIADIDQVLEDRQKVADEVKQMSGSDGDVRGSIQFAIVKTIENNEHLEPDTGKVIAHNLLYLACTCGHGMGAEALSRAKDGGHVLYYQITRIPNGTPLGRAHFRLLLDPSSKFLRMPRSAQDRALADKRWVDERH